MTRAQAGEKARAFVDKFTLETMHSGYTVIEANDRDRLVLDLATLLLSTEAAFKVHP